MPEVEISPGTLINQRYQLQKVLGQGGFGRTYLASDVQRFGELCVLKEFVPSSRGEFALQKSRHLFEREAAVLHQIKHPQIPRFLAWFTQEERLFLVQEYIDGQTYASLLRERHQQNQKFTEAEILQWLKDLLPVLTYLHERKIVHRDISPDNIMLPVGQAQPILIDFGLVKETVSQLWTPEAEGSRKVNQASLVGKIGYAPPEQIRLGQCYPCSDLYALGVSAIVLLTGHDPDLLMDESLEWEWRSYVQVSEPFGQVLDKMLVEKPKYRYQSAREVLADLQQCRQPEPEGVRELFLGLDIAIDQDKKQRQLAEIESMDFFQALQEEAELLRNSMQADLEVSLPLEAAEAPLAEARLETDLLTLYAAKPEPPQEPDLLPVYAAKPEPLPQDAPSPGLDPVFLEHCQQELANCLGPMASYVLEDVLDRLPQASPQQLVETLVAEIDNPKQAQALRSRLETLLKKTQILQLARKFRMLYNESAGGSSPSASSSSPSMSGLGFAAPEVQPPTDLSYAIDSEVLDRCRKALTRYVGPMALFILEEVQEQYPQVSPQQLVGLLAAEITNPRQAAEFQMGLKDLL